ncbi:hypothetical protein ABZ714_03060 [Streptomyces sp. NPDC006798]|uniref:hypothetical protein n=1 Tax=Streptomyces sp. NPDC006798 TaxID=3155462 RepID=UPI00340000CB
MPTAVRVPRRRGWRVPRRARDGRGTAAPGPGPADRLDAALDCPAGPGRPERDPVLLVHGTGVDAGPNWARNDAPALRDLGYDVCTVDLPG